MNERIKKVTQSITGLIFWPTVILAPSYLMAKIGQHFGLWTAIDGFFPSSMVIYVTLMIVSRAIYMTIWIYGGWGFATVGVNAGYFWFKKEREYHSSEPDPVDLTPAIVGAIAAIVILLCFAEVAIRIVTMTDPPYMLINHPQ